LQKEACLEERGCNALVHLQLLAAPVTDFSGFCPRPVPDESAVGGFSAKSWVSRGLLPLLSQTRDIGGH